MTDQQMNNGSGPGTDGRQPVRFGLPNPVKNLVVKRRKFLIVIAAFFVLGSAFLARSQADTITNSQEAEDGVIAGNAGVGDIDGASGGASVKFGTSGDDNTMTATCQAATPLAPVVGYAAGGCEDFNNGFGNFTPYTGGGEGTVTGPGRTAYQEMCAISLGTLKVSQRADGGTCGGDLKMLNSRYGLWETRMKITASAGSGTPSHPVLLLWPDSEVWSDGELDYFEIDLGDKATGYLHCTNGSGIENNCFTLPENNVDYAQYHVYSFEWAPDHVTGWIDGEQWYTTTGSSWQPKGSMHPTVQNDCIGCTTPIQPSTIEVDWMHHFTRP